jgi:hypothetical protein
MTAIKEKAAGLAPETALGTPSRRPNSNTRNVTAKAECGKQAAIAAYTWGVISGEGCARLFRQHPDWRGA